MDFLDNSIDIWKFKDIITSNIPIVDLMKEYGIKLEPRATGQFSHRTFCPFHRGKNGRIERTPSMFVSEQTNSFCCFGCGHGGSVIDFVQLMDGSPPMVALTKLAKQIGLIDKDGKWDELKISAFGGVPEIEPVKSIEPFLFEISSILRNYIKLFINTPKFNEEFRWMEKVAERVDEFLSNIGHEDWEYAKDIYENVQRSVKNRMRKKGINNEDSNSG